MSAQIVTANRLTDGLVVYFDGSGWSERLDSGRVAGDEEEAARLLDNAEAEAAGDAVVGPYLVEIAGRKGVRQPTRLRERIRALGPSIGGFTTTGTKDA